MHRHHEGLSNNVDRRQTDRITTLALQLHCNENLMDSNMEERSTGADVFNSVSVAGYNLGNTFG